jgi:hypothetical protein
MSDPIAEMLESVGKELAQAGVSLETLANQATGKAGMEAPDGLSLLAAKFSPEHALWFFEFLRGYLTSAKDEKPGELPDPAKFAPQIMASLAAFPMSEAERKEVLDSLMQPFEKADAPEAPAAESPKAAGAKPEETPEEMVANLEKKAEELQKQLDAKLAELKVEAAPPEPPAGEPAQAPEASEKAVGEVEKAVNELQKALEEALSKLPPGEPIS